MTDTKESPSPLFSAGDIRRLVLPLIVEQFLAVTVGMADIMMIAGVGELAVSGISVVDTLNILLINVFSALATGGAVVASHFLGQGKKERACRAANQLILVIFIFSVFLAAVSLLFNYQILAGIYGHLEPAVMGYARTYYYLTAMSFPFLAIYNGAAAICRSMGNSKISMKVSFMMNGMNVVGNAVLIFVFHMEVAGAGISTLVSRATAALILLWIIRNQKLPLHIAKNLHLGYDPDIIRQILRIGLPIGIESGLFQGGKLMVAGLISSFGTASIAANAVANTLASFQVIPGTAIGLALVTVVGQSVGAQRYREAKKYAISFCFMTVAAHLAICLPMTFFLPQLIRFYNLSDVTAHMAYQLALIHGISCVLIWAPSFALPNALRAADDVKFVMYVTMSSMFICRVAMSYVLGSYFGLGVMGVWIAMIMDWVVRGVIYSYRLLGGGWLKCHFRHLKQSY